VRTRAGTSLARLIEQADTSTTPGAILLISGVCTFACALAAALIVRHWVAAPVAAVIGAFAPVWWLKHRRTRRLRQFEEQFPEVLELLSRALRAGHSFQTALGMAGTELRYPASAEFQKVFDEQKFGLPLKDALAGLAERIPLLDVRFFATAVL